tara:strand:- start:1990 stop:2676 length:687 start_codon:yes stop_codon:yes gene_type:complete
MASRRLDDKRIRFDAAPHRYYVRQDGRQLPGTHRVLRQAGMMDVTYFTEDTASRGTAIHRGCELIGRRPKAADGWGDLDQTSVEPVILPFLERYRGALARHQITVLATERLVAEPLLTAATLLDAWVEIDGQAGPLEIKSGVRVPSDRYQLAAQMTMTHSIVGWMLYLQDAHPRPVPLMGTAYLSARQIWNICLTLFHRRVDDGDTSCWHDRPGDDGFHIGRYGSRSA